ncbi:MAG: hypothetical protein EZS28_000552 [Streblomastix strix]|uniref:Uncharacterized protein n=1 Tax=Streblomastix strix TaxID=222440 RepID=A0A5J4X9T5_9EUKA|nr:MAG: hypothetical protein EZS28_000552 [Streblomastix strix]
MAESNIKKSIDDSRSENLRDSNVQHKQWNREIKRWTSYMRELEAIFFDLFYYGQIFRELQIKGILIKSDSSTAVQDIEKQRAEETLVADVKKIVKLLKQDNRCSKQTKYTGRIHSKEGDIQGFLPCEIDNTNTGLVRYRGKQTRGQDRGNSRGR